MSKRLRGPTSSVETGKVPAVRVKLKEVNYQHAIPYPPDGQAHEWWQRLKNAFGTTSSAFVEASLYQLIAKGYFSIYQQGRSLMSRDGESGSTTFGSMAAQWADTRCPAGASLERGL